MTIFIAILTIVLVLGACAKAAVAPTPEQSPPAPTQAPPPTPTQKTVEFKLISLEVVPEILAYGDEATATVQISNVGEVEGCYTCILEIADLPIKPKEVTLASGATETISFTFIPKEVGSHEVVVGDLTQTIEVRRPASFSVSPYFFYITPNPAEPGSSVTVTVDVENNSDIEGTDIVTLEIDGEEVESLEVTIGPDETETVEFAPFVKDTPGEYTVRVEGEWRTLVVIPDQEPPETGTYIVKVMTTGKNRMTIENKLLSDAVAVLCKENSTVPLIAVYIQSFDKFTISKIKRGTYNLYFTTGQYWDEEFKKFIIGAEYLRSPLEYECLSSASTYWKWYVELLPGAVPVAEEDFPNLITPY
ncbi:CARDB domain-containing protein [Chloroflexota bacterium]